MMFSLLLALAAVPLDAPRPNIVLILADDLGAGDVDYDNSRNDRDTPSLARLAREGMRFTQAYAPAPICSASRAAILTGQSPARLQFEFVTKDEPGQQLIEGTPLVAPPYTLDLPSEKQTFAECVREAGYDTAFFGKWHVNRHYRRYLGWNPDQGPAQQGFDTATEEFGSHPYNPDSGSWNSPEPLPDGVLPNDALTNLAVDYLASRSESERPFLLMVSHFYVHTPVKPRVKWLTDRYRRRLPKASDARVRYAAFVHMLDAHVGQLLDAIDDQGLGRNTFVVFLSDNGGDPQFTEHAPLRGHKWTLYEGGVRIPMIVRWPGRIEPGSVCNRPVIGTDLLPTFVDLAQAALPDDQPLDGRSLASLWNALDHTSGERTFVWHFPYYHPESKAGPIVEPIGTNDTRVPFMEPHSAIRTGDEKLMLFYESQRIERSTYDTQGRIDEQPEPLTGEAAAQARKRIMTVLRSHNARLPVARPVD